MFEKVLVANFHGKLFFLAAKISTDETSELGSKENYIRKLLSIVQERTNDIVVDITLKFTLSALWNLTDDSPKPCQVFLDENGMKLYLDVLISFRGELAVETKVTWLILVLLCNAQWFGRDRNTM